MKNNKKVILWVVVVALIIAVALLGYFLYKKDNEVKLVSRNLYNNNFNVIYILFRNHLFQILVEIIF